ncbi:hypothetical protein [Pareuzebyella sediminis]|uniref:hypothetical protein n=1 Tax=Pareuzebyella sediminis TaxID=2607998 RepID=UPI0011EE3B4E|nr:hypothetical protein [Pareuzebyella sediminis]
MKLRIAIRHYFVLYFLLLMVLYHYKVKHYFYWDYIAELKDGEFGFSFLRCLSATVLFFFNLYLLNSIRRTKLIFIVLALFFALLTIPSLIAFTSADMYSSELLWYHQALFFGLYFLSKIKIDFSRIPVLNKTQALYLLLILTTLGVVPYLIVYGPHINLKNLVLIDVYQTRSTMGNLGNAYFGYTYSLFTKIFIPLIIVFSLELKKKVWTLVGALYLILFYLFGAHKTVYVGLIVVLVFYRFSFAQSVKMIVKYGSLAIIACILLALIGYDYPWILSFRRVHFLPTLLDICYLDFFEGKPLYWSESILKGFVEYPYDVRPTHLIGEFYFNRPDMSANNGLVSEGYMNFGGWGVLINIAIVSAFFMVLNSLKIPAKYFGLFVLAMFSFLSSSVFTVLLTHGGVALILVSIFLLKNSKE